MGISFTEREAGFLDYPTAYNQYKMSVERKNGP
jgi:hypothetical protein